MKRFSISLLLAVILSFGMWGVAHTASPIGDVVEFSPASNWQIWVIRTSNETGHGQQFLTAPGTQAIQTVALKLCRQGEFTKPKTLTLCQSAESSYYAGCQTPIASKEFSAAQLNTLINYDPDCMSSNEGGPDDGQYFHWAYFTFDNPVSVSENTSYFFLLNSASSADNEGTFILRTMYNNEHYNGSSVDYPNGQEYYYRNATRYTYGASTDIFFKVFSANPVTVPFAITSPTSSQQVVNDSWITVSGTCPINGVNRIGVTEDCLGFDQIDYTIACINNTFSAELYHSSISDHIAAREVSSVSTDCVNYDQLMDVVSVDGIDFVNGYPQDWYFDFDLYQDYDIQITAPLFDSLITLPRGNTSQDVTFRFVYPTSSLPNLTFNIRQYNNDGVSLNDNFHTQALTSMSDTGNYTVSMAASSTPFHYVVQLLDNGVLKRQFPFSIYVTDREYIGNPDSSAGYFFPRIVAELRKKVVFNYYFAFHDGFYTMFNRQYAPPDPNALDITFKSVSGDKQYNIDLKVFSASDPRVRAFASGIRPHVVAILWLMFALYVVFRVTHLFSDNQ